MLQTRPVASEMYDTIVSLLFLVYDVKLMRTILNTINSTVHHLSIPLILTRTSKKYTIGSNYDGHTTYNSYLAGCSTFWMEPGCDLSVSGFDLASYMKDSFGWTNPIPSNLIPCIKYQDYPYSTRMKHIYYGNGRYISSILAR